MSKLPWIDPDLIKGLEEVFPNTLPDAAITTSELARLIGQQDVIRYLIRKMAEQAA